MTVAEQVNAWRVMPRVLIAGYGWMMYEVSMWFMALPDPTSQQSAFVSTMAATSAAVFGLYTNSGGRSDV